MTISTIFTLAGWALLIGLGLYVFYVVSMRSQRRDSKISVLAVAVLLIGSVTLLTLGAGLVFIDQFESGVVVSPLSQGGVRPDPIGPGVHFVTPFIETVDRFTTAKQEYTMSGAINEGAQQGNDAVEARTSDGQQVYIDATVRYYADPTKVVDLRRTWQGQDRYIQGFVRPTARNVVYNMTARYKVEDVYGVKRTELQQVIRSVGCGVHQAGPDPGGVPTTQYHLLAGVCPVDRAETDRTAAVGTGQTAGAEEPARSRSAAREGQRRGRCRDTACHRRF